MELVVFPQSFSFYIRWFLAWYFCSEEDSASCYREGEGFVPQRDPAAEILEKRKDCNSSMS